MWWGSGTENPEGDGSSKEPPQNQQLVDLQDQFEQQQTLIAQLKEMLRKTEQSSVVSREKVDEYASTLSEINERAKRSKLRKSEARKSELDDSIKSGETSTRKSTVVTPAKEKINLLRKQLEENREKIAQRDKNQKGFEEMVNQLKAQFDDSQVIINQSQINIPKVDTKPVIVTSYTLESSREDLLSVIKTKDEFIEELNAKVQQLQANVLDLQENVKEKDCVIEARTKAITLLSENLSKKGKNTLDMLDETKEQMRVMQQNFVALETKMKEENIQLQTDLERKENQVLRLEERNNELENKCSDLQEVNQKLEQAVNSKVDNTEIEIKMKELSAMNESLKTKLSVLEREDGDSRSSSERTEQKTTASPQKSGKRGKGNKKSKPEPRVSDSVHLTRITELEKLVEDLEKQTQNKQSDVTDGDEIVKLNKQLEDMNKTMIKMKAQHKAKLKEVQKKSDVSEFVEKVTNLESDNLKLGQRVAELEVEKGNLQLRLVDYESNKDKEYIADLENKIEEQKMEIENHIRTITTLEAQITTSANEISSLRGELANFMHIENAQVCSEMTSVQLEEQLDKEVSQKKEIQNSFNTIVKENEGLLEKIDTLNKEKQELGTKLENYMQENMDLIDRLEKLSAEKVSSAESIEIVESLTQQEKLEIEAYQKHMDFPSDKPGGDNSELEESPELNESVTKLTEETTELMERIELFAVERREVMDKMDNLTSENQQLISKIEKYESEKLNLEERYDNLCNERDILNTKVENLLKENEELLQKVEAFSKEIHEKENIASKEESDSLKEQITEYQTLLVNQKQQIIALQGELLKKTENEFITKVNLAKINEEKGNLNQQLCTLQDEYDALMKENQALKQNLKDNSELVHEKDSLEKVLRETREKLLNLESDLSKNVNLVNDLHNQIEENKTELTRSTDSIAQLHAEISLKHSECETYKKETEDLRDTVSQLNYQIEQKDKMNDDNSDTINFLSSQLTELKECMTENFDQLQQYESEINKNTGTIDKLTEQLNELNYKIVETEHMLELKDVEINNLQTEHNSCEHRIANLGAELKQKDEHFAENCRQLKEKCKSLENQIHSNTGTLDDIRGPFETKIAELETKNKEQVDKMKKIAANLKKKVVTCHDLESKLKELKEKWEDEHKEKDEKQKVIDEQQMVLRENQTHIDSLVTRLQEIQSALSSVQVELENTNQLKMNSDNQLELLTQQYTNLSAKTQNYEVIVDENTKLNSELVQSNANVIQLRETIREKDTLIEHLNSQVDILQSDSERNQSETVQKLQDELDSLKVSHETTKNAMDAKLQEKDMFIESVEAENSKYKERVFKLEEGLSNIEERRQSLEDKALDLKVQLEAKVTACEEACQSEDFLERRLAALMSHDEIIEKTLKQTTMENQELNVKLKVVLSENDALQTKLNETVSQLRENEQSNDKYEMIENENVRLTTIITGLESEMKRIQSEYERQIAGKNNEIENMETELNAQVQELNAERKNILNRCEHLEDNIKEYTNNEQLLNDENDQLKQALLKMRTDLDKYGAENENLNVTIASNLLKIEQLEKELSNVELPVDVTSTESLRNEIDSLQRIITQKDSDIQNYQRQNMQLQMASFTAPPTASLFESSSSVFDITPSVNTSEVQSLKDSLTESDMRCTRLENQTRDMTEQLINTQSELQQLQEKFNALQTENNVLLNDLERETQIVLRLQDELSNQQETLLRQTAEVGVNDIISTAEDRVAQNTPVIAEKNEQVEKLERNLKKITEERDNALERIKQFTSEQQGGREEIVTKQEQRDVSAVPVRREKMTEEESKAELLNKIKTLEFMLFNIEKEKDDTLAQCHEFTNELTRLVYEREKLIKDKSEVTPARTDVDLGALEGLIIQHEDVDSTPEVRQQLCSLEYPPVRVQVNKIVTETIELEPVVEDILQPKSTYQCFDKDPHEVQDSTGEASGWETEDSKIKESLESQILMMDATKITPEERQQFENIEFERIQIPAPKTQPIAVQKSAYLCYPDECKDILSADTFASEEDGWGWNAEEAKLEAEHRQTLTAARQPSPVHAKVEQLEERINDLEVERSRLLEEIKTSQVRSDKLIKKLKDLKLKNDSLTIELNKKSSRDFCDLDLAIQDELHVQIKTMEKRIAELNDENVKEKSERESMLKRIDVLTSANERMIEMKEKQDGEIQFWQFKNRELSSRLEQLEWGDDSGSKTPASHGSPVKSAESDANATEYKKQCDELNSKVQELNSTVNDLTLDNEEMQCMLEEQRKLRLDAEKALANIPVQENMKTEQEFLKIEHDNRSLSEQVSKLNEEKVQLQNQVDFQVNLNEELNSKARELQLNIERLVQENHTSTNQITVRIEQLQMEKQELENQIQQLNIEYETGIANQIETNRSEILQLQGQISTLQEEKRQLENVVAENEILLNHLQLKVQQMESEKSACELKIQEILSLQNAGKSNDEKLLRMNEKLMATFTELENKTKEVAELNIQDMNEKLMAAFTELENKNKEVAELNILLNAERVQSQQTLSNAVEQLSMEWSDRLDQRGNDVAESWKLHLEARETEFAQKEENLQSQLNGLSSQNEELEKQLESVMHAQNTASNNVIESLQQTLDEKQLEIVELSKELQVSLNELQTKRSEIENMQQSLEVVSIKDTELSELKTQKIEMEEHYENLLSSNNSDLASLRLQISERDRHLTKADSDRKNLQKQLDTKIVEYQQLEAKINELDAIAAEENSQIVEMRQLIETQVLKIEELKRELYEKSNDYDALVAEFDSLHPSEEVTTPVKAKHVHFEDSAVQSPVQEVTQESDNLAEPVSRAELDLALYMWHQRDVRCEELTLELMHLLEERDTLQLRLSNALRLNEDLRKASPQQSTERQPTADKDSPKLHKSTGAVPKSKSTAIVLGATGTELATEATEQTTTTPGTETTGDKENLADKLSQLRSIGYRDKTLQDDQETRYIQQMSVMQQHRDLASKLPAEAAARLVDASYTLSRDVQSPSKVLLNWLWGRSTPKVNDV